MNSHFFRDFWRFFGFVALTNIGFGAVSFAAEQEQNNSANIATADLKALIDDGYGVHVSSILGDSMLTSSLGREFLVFPLIQRYSSPAVASNLSLSQPRINNKSARFLVQGGLHGNETLAPQFVIWLARRFEKGESTLNSLANQEKLDVAIDFLPYANPDGLARMSRYNAHGVNLNRNFGVLWGISRENPGTEQFSEAETKAIKRLIENRKYTAAVDVHGYVNWVVAPSAKKMIEVAANSTVSDSNESAGVLAKVREHRLWLASLSNVVSALGSSYELKTAAELGDGGAFEDWTFWQGGAMAFCLELASPERLGGRSSGATNVAGLWSTMLSRLEPDRREDLFLRYERAVYQAFESAINIRLRDSTFASNTKSQP